MLAERGLSPLAALESSNLGDQHCVNYGSTMKNKSKICIISTIIFMGVITPIFVGPSSSDNALSGQDSAGRRIEIYTSQSVASDQLKPALNAAADPLESKNIRLWRLEKIQEIQVDGVKAITLTLDPSVLNSFHVGQQIKLQLPHTDLPVSAIVTSTHNEFGNVHVWQSIFEPAEQYEAMTIVKGEIETHITINKDRYTYTAIINNASGETTLMDESNWRENELVVDDAVPVSLLPDTQPNLQ